MNKELLLVVFFGGIFGVALPDVSFSAPNIPVLGWDHIGDTPADEILMTLCFIFCAICILCYMCLPKGK